MMMAAEVESRLSVDPVPAPHQSPTSITAPTAAKNTTAIFSSAGSYTLTATIIDADGQSTTSSVNVTVTSALTSIAVSPNTAIVNPGSTQQLGAIGLDQFGKRAFSSSFSWSIASGPGTVSAAGLYTAASSQGGLVAVRASSGSVTGTAIITVPMDNTDGTANGVNLVGSWTGSTTVGAWFGSNYSFSNTAGNTATYSASIPLTGLYTVAARWPAFTNRGSSVPISVTSADGTATVNVNQRNNDGQWVILGTYHFTAGMTGKAIITAPANADGSTVADAVRFQLVQAVPTITAAATATPAPITSGSTTLSVLGADFGGEPALTYTWATSAMPSGAATPASAQQRHQRRQEYAGHSIESRQLLLHGHHHQ